jgi:UDP-2,4-diacetamido-2,4,6-trideoxy-beta-L-altropyranose hydrolase
MNNLVVRADAGTLIGNGHIMRCLALAHSWHCDNDPVTFIVAESSPFVEKEISSKGFEIIPVKTKPGSPDDARITSACARERDACWIVADGYTFNSDFQNYIKKQGQHLLFIDDFVHADYYLADVVLNQNIYAQDSMYTKKAPYTKLLLGSDFALIRENFLSWIDWKRENPRHAKKILVTLGGSDPKNITSRVLDALETLSLPSLEVKVVISGNNPEKDQLHKRVLTSNHYGEIIEDAPNMPELMSWADIALSAGGSTNLELAFMGVPAITLNHSENQILNSRVLEKNGVVKNLGWYEQVSCDTLSQSINHLINSMKDRKTMSVMGKRLVDGFGAKRVCGFLRDEQNVT